MKQNPSMSSKSRIIRIQNQCRVHNTTTQVLIVSGIIRSIDSLKTRIIKFSIYSNILQNRVISEIDSPQVTMIISKKECNSINNIITISPKIQKIIICARSNRYLSYSSSTYKRSTQFISNILHKSSLYIRPTSQDIDGISRKVR